MMEIKPEWILKMAEKEGNGFVSVGGFMRRNFYKRHSGNYVWVALKAINEKNYLEYVPNGICPHASEFHNADSFEEYWERIEPEEAKSLIKNMEEQDNEYAYRLSKKDEMESLAKAMKILNNKRVASVRFYENVVRISTDNGVEYEVSLQKEGYASRQIGLPDLC